MIQGYYYILEIDAPKSAKGYWFLKSPGKGWKKTEGDEQAEFEGELHRKFVRVAKNLRGLKTLIDDYDLASYEGETGGALTEFGLLSAVAIRNEGYLADMPNIDASLYVGVMAETEEDFQNAVEQIKQIHVSVF